MTSPVIPSPPPPAAMWGRPMPPPPLPRTSSTCEGSSLAFGLKRTQGVTLDPAGRSRAPADPAALVRLRLRLRSGLRRRRLRDRGGALSAGRRADAELL